MMPINDVVVTINSLSLDFSVAFERHRYLKAF